MKILKSLFFMSCLAWTLTVWSDPVHHFNVKMQNRSSRDVTLRFEVVQGNVSLMPQLNDNTLLQSGETTNRYGVFFDPLTTTDSFNIIFHGNKDCAFKIEFFAPGSPKVTQSGLGCRGGGYEIVDQGSTLLLFVSQIYK